jgi:hypothetical protein
MPFKKGQSGNPSGRPKETEQEKIVKQMTRETYAEMAHAMMTCTKEELEDMIARGLPFESELFIRMMLNLAEKGDWGQYEKYLNQRIGKVPDKVDHSGTLTLESLVAGSMEKKDD